MLRLLWLLLRLELGLGLRRRLLLCVRLGRHLGCASRVATQWRAVRIMKTQPKRDVHGVDGIYIIYIHNTKGMDLCTDHDVAADEGPEPEDEDVPPCRCSSRGESCVSK